MEADYVHSTVRFLRDDPIYKTYSLLSMTLQISWAAQSTHIYWHARTHYIHIEACLNLNNGKGTNRLYFISQNEHVLEI